MTRERRYGVDTRVRSRSPQRPLPRYRDILPSRRPEYSARRRGVDDLHAVDRTRESQRSRRTERRDHFDKDFARFSNYDGRDRDRNRRKDGVGRSWRLYDEDSLIGNPAEMKFRGDRLLDEPWNSSGLNVKDYVNDCRGVSDTNTTRVSGERDYYPRSQYLDEGKFGLLAGSQYLGGSKSIPQESGSKSIPRETKMKQRIYSDPYTLDHVGAGNLFKSSSGHDVGTCHAPSLSVQYLSNNTHKDAVHFSGELHLEKEGRHFQSPDESYLDKNDDRFNVGHKLQLDELVNISINRETYKYNREDNLLSSRSYLNCTMSSSRPNYTMGSPGFSSKGDLHMPNGTGVGIEMSSKRISCDRHYENSQNGSSLPPSQNIRRYPKSYFGTDEERCRDNFYPDSGRCEIGSSSTDQ